MRLFKRITLGVGFAIMLTGCFGPAKYSLVGHYYTAQSEDGEPGLYFDDPQLGLTYLKFAVATGKTKDCVVACGDSCYMFPVAATTVEAARRAQIGPLTEEACKQKVFQLTGDSLKLESFIL